MSIATKRCFKCLEVKPITAFYKHVMMGDGHLNKCKECAKKDALAHRWKKVEQYRQYDKMRASMPHRVALRKRTTNEWNAMFPNRRKAQTALRYAVKTGVVQKLQCFICGADAEAHHPNYDAPLDVVWLCPPHHKQAHALVRKAA
jgi:hypothetical protein